MLSTFLMINLILLFNVALQHRSWGHYPLANVAWAAGKLRGHA
jgi:hypothetical protein